MDYGKKLKWAIHNAGYTQREIAERLGIPDSTLSNQLRRPTLDTMESICAAVGVPMSRIVSQPGDQLVEITERESELLSLFGEFPPDKQAEVIEILRRIRDVMK